MTILKVLLLVASLFTILLPSSSSPQTPEKLSLATSPTFTLIPGNATALPGDTAYATVTVHSTGSPVTVNVKLGNYDTDSLNCDNAPTPSSLKAPPDVNATISCTSDSSGNFPVPVVGIDPNNPSMTELVQVYFNFSQARGSSGQQQKGSSTIEPSSNAVPLIYIALGAAVIVIAVMASITAYAFRKWKV